mmetsp:Transcript_21898/g.16222  ORF Transcript_21898/g.16222 Transcript_21898/m.16222 type:complete len:157 (-) Transcript_21898:530-1000(-)
MKRLTYTKIYDPTFYSFTADMFLIYLFLFKLVLFLCCFYFAKHDFQQIKGVTGNKIVLWSYANLLPLVFIIAIVVYDTVYEAVPTDLEKAFYSLSAFFIWIRIVHLMKCYSQTAYLLRMAGEIIYRMRYLIVFVVLSLIAFGFTYFFLSDNYEMSP